MAVKDVKNYYYQVSSQYLKMKATLEEFNEEFKKGNITEDRLENVKGLVDAMEQNYNRVSYIMHLLELPNRPEKKEKAKRADKKLVVYFENKRANAKAIDAENKSALDTLRAELDKLVADSKKEASDSIEKELAEYDAKYSLKSKQN